MTSLLSLSLFAVLTFYTPLTMAHTSISQALAFSPALLERTRLVYRWLIDIGVAEPEQVIEKFPGILSLSVEVHLEPQLQWLKRAQVKDPTSLIVKDPQIWLTLHQENIPANELDLSPSQRRKLIANVASKIWRAPMRSIPKLSKRTIEGVRDYKQPEISEENLLTEWGFSPEEVITDPDLQNLDPSSVWRMLSALQYLRIDPAEHLSLAYRKKALLHLEPSDIFRNLQRMQIVPTEAHHLWEIPESRLLPSQWFINNPHLWLRKSSQCPLL